MKTFFNDSEYQEIAKHFRLGEIKSIKHFSGGLDAPKVGVETEKGNFVIAKNTLGDGSTFKTKPKNSLAKEIKLLNALANLPVPHYVPDKKGEFILDYKNFAVTAYKYLKGKQPAKTLNKEQSFDLGKFLGEFHKRGLQLDEDFSGRRSLYSFTPKKILEMRSYAYNQTNRKLLNVVQEVEKGVLSNELPSGLPRGPIHMDVKDDNLLYKKNTLTGVLDFGNFYLGLLVTDLGKTIVFNCTKEGSVEPTLMNSMLKGYEQERLLDDKEKNLLKQAVRSSVYNHIWLDLYHVPLKIVPESHTLYFVENFLPAVRNLK